ncbi:hypothetical protein GQR58_005786 [Nymphon striatum]|nr:hypothetical protein GQR58_005786 [Nymphon striatum]
MYVKKSFNNFANSGSSGADTVASLHGIGKATVIKIAKQGKLSLSEVGDVKADMKSVQAQATKFICAAYGKVADSCTSMTECRVKMWRFKTGKSGASSVKLCSLPPTNDAFVQNIHICHFEVATWKAALLESPPTLNPTSHGWEMDHQGALQPRTIPADKLSAPPEILKLIHCSCKTSGCITAAAQNLVAQQDLDNQIFILDITNRIKPHDINEKWKTKRATSLDFREKQNIIYIKNYYLVLCAKNHSCSTKSSFAYKVGLMRQNVSSVVNTLNSKSQIDDIPVPLSTTNATRRATDNTDVLPLTRNQVKNDLTLTLVDPKRTIVIENIENHGQFRDSMHLKQVIDRADNSISPLISQGKVSLLTGDAKRCVDGLSINTTNYEVAIKLLKDRFGRKEVITLSHIQNLLALEIQNGSNYIVKLKHFQDDLLANIRSLGTLDVTDEKFGAILTPLILSRLPENFRLEWSREGQGDENELQYQLNFIKKEIRRLERSEMFNLKENKHPTPTVGKKKVEVKEGPQPHYCLTLDLRSYIGSNVAGKVSTKVDDTQRISFSTFGSKICHGVVCQTRCSGSQKKPENMWPRPTRPFERISFQVTHDRHMLVIAMESNGKINEFEADEGNFVVFPAAQAQGYLCEPRAKHDRFPSDDSDSRSEESDTEPENSDHDGRVGNTNW